MRLEITLITGCTYKLNATITAYKQFCYRIEQKSPVFTPDQVWIYNLLLLVETQCIASLRVTVKHYRHYQHQHIFVHIAILW